MRCTNANGFVRAPASLLSWSAAASVARDRCHAGGGRQLCDMWEWEQAGNRIRANAPHSLLSLSLCLFFCFSCRKTANPSTAVEANAFLNALQSSTLQLINYHRRPSFSESIYDLLREGKCIWKLHVTHTVCVSVWYMNAL